MIDAIALTLVLLVVAVSALISIRLGVTAATVEIILAMLVGNITQFQPDQHEWLVFLGGLSGVMLAIILIAIIPGLIADRFFRPFGERR